MTDNAFYLVLAIIIFAIFFNALVAYGEKRNRIAWRQRKTKSKKRLLTQKKQR